MTSRREAREARQNAQGLPSLDDLLAKNKKTHATSTPSSSDQLTLSGTDERLQSVGTATASTGSNGRGSSSGSGGGSSGGSRGRGSDAHGKGSKPKRPLLKRPAFWIPVSIVIVLIGLGVGGALAAKQVYGDAMSAKDDLEQALPLVDGVKQSLLAGDATSAQATAQQIAELTKKATGKTDGPLWRSVEWVPVVGPNLAAVRIAAASADSLIHDAVLPLTSLSLDALIPTNGAIDVARLQELSDVIGSAASSVAHVRSEIDSIDRDAVIDQVATAVTKIDSGLDEIEPYLEPVHNALEILPGALGADGQRNYLLLFQNNAESRGTGGNPAAIAVLTADNGALTMTAQAGSGDFPRRSSPITDLDPETQALYGDKLGRFVMDTTITPDFTETASLVRAFWAESFGTPVDGVASFDPVALSYLLQATGPVALPTGETLTVDNAVPLLLSDVYTLYPDTEEQDAFFAGAAAAVFGALTSQSPDPTTLIDALAKATDEGRLLFAPGDTDEAALIAGTKVSGTMPTNNEDATVLGAYVNDITEGKLDYYLQLDVAAQCTAVDDASSDYAISAAVTNTLTGDAVDDLAPYVAPAKFFAKGDISTDLVLYGPVGSTLTSVSVDGNPIPATGLPHLGRVAVKINVLTEPGVTHTVTATFATPSEGAGPIEVRHTPMVRPTPVNLTDCN